MLQRLRVLLPTNRRDWQGLACFYLAVFVVQTLGGWFTQTSVADWYPTLTKSALNPPGIVFGIMWSGLYVLQAIAAWRIWRVLNHELVTTPMIFWLMQLLAGLLWTVIFFGLRDPVFALVVIVFVMLIIAYTIHVFWRIDKPAAKLLVPSLLWVCFATYLQFYIVLHN